jgi:trimeric autotransporter adhesin
VKFRRFCLSLFFSAVFTMVFGGIALRASTPAAPTTTTLALTTGSQSAESIASGTVLTLTATVTADGSPLTTGQVSFCDAASSYCTDIHLLGTAQLTSTGTAVLKFVPGIGTHSYKAIFSGTTNNASSTSGAELLTVTGTYPTATTIAQSGGIGNYTLAATVVGVGSQSTALTGMVSFVDTTIGNQVLATATPGSGTAGLSFLTSSNLTTASEASSMVVGDFNGDGKQDIAFETVGSSVVNVMLGNGDGTLTAAPSPQLPNSLGHILATADFNGDGKADLLIDSQADPRSNVVVTVLLGNGDGTFTAATGPALGQGVLNVAGDFNRDGIPDLVASGPCGAGASGSCLSTFLGNGDGTFSKGPTSTDPLYETSGFIVTADFNGDGIPDLFIPSGGTSSTGVFLGNGDGTFTRSATLQTGSASGASLAADFNGDGKVDLAITTYPAQVLIFMGNGDGTFTAAPSLDFTALGTPTSVVAGDFNGDGKTDLVVAVNKTIALYVGNGDGTFTPSTSATEAGPVGSLVSSDFNGDGKPDLVAPLFSSTSVAAPLDVLLTQLTQTVSVSASNIAPASLGTHAVLASYPGDSHYSASVSATTMLISKATTALTLGATPTGGSIANQQVVLTATLTPNTGGGQSSNGESIIFFSGATSIGTASLSNGIATLNTSSIPTGTSSLTASYVGDSVLLASTSNAVSYTVQAVPTVVVTPATSGLTVSTAGSVTDTFTLTTSAGYSGAVQFTCTNLPQNTTCSFQPSSIMFTGTNSSATVSVTLQTGVTAQGALSPLLPNLLERTNGVFAAMIWIPGLFVARLTRRLRGPNKNSILLLLVLCSVCATLTACSGGSSATPASAKTPVGIYTVHVVTSGQNGLSQNTSLNLTVQ